jgi:hypothetical protein
VERRLEGPGSDHRLQQLQRRFRRLNAAAARLEWVELFRLCLLIFALVVAIGLAGPWILAKLG